jgi:hypothetical protein
METFAIKNFSLTNTEIKLGEMKRVQPCSKLKDKKPRIQTEEIFNRRAFRESLQIRNRFCKNNSVACVSIEKTLELYDKIVTNKKYSWSESYIDNLSKSELISNIEENNNFMHILKRWIFNLEMLKVCANSPEISKSIWKIFTKAVSILRRTFDPKNRLSETMSMLLMICPYQIVQYDPFVYPEEWKGSLKTQFVTQNKIMKHIDIFINCSHKMCFKSNAYDKKWFFNIETSYQMLREDPGSKIQLEAIQYEKLNSIITIPSEFVEYL